MFSRAAWRSCLLIALAFAPVPIVAQVESTMAAGGNSPGFDMAPKTRLEVVEEGVAAIPDKIPAGPFKPDWESPTEPGELVRHFFDHVPYR